MSVVSIARPALSRAELAELTQRYAEEVREGRHEVHADPDERWHVRLHCDDQVDVWLISWTRSQGTELHDHGGSSGAFTVVEGTLTESVWSGPVEAGRLRELERGTGSTVTFGEHYVHDVCNTAEPVAVSVHAYSPPLALMNFYDAEDGALQRLATSWTDDPEIATPTYRTVDEMLSAARSGITRLSPEQAAAAAAEGALIVDIRPVWQREVEGEIAGSIIVERNHLEWRVHPDSDARLPQAVQGQRWIVLCQEGYTSSLAAAALASLGIPAADVEGGIKAWTAAGLPVVPGVTGVEQVVPAERAADGAASHAS
ncbi:rhodanese-like domain-containing protein [Nocardioides sp. BP30]|uniref:rhodanese-like domain-containing protein n=1 Tax=Nocardioides sp. BP30 TaxID=3036374 RepID=UPI0024687161|nr:rhodanese-like domain-containing protein [Nocardioides sp. BP30]WGL51576.1 rhodanese-like domain-containing protein [Nocardioides sp. BP30]